MDTNFRRALAVVLKFEGGWSDHPSDPGGATFKGITLDTLTRWWRRLKRDKRPTKADLRQMGEDEIERVYATLYWKPSGAALLASGLDLIVFDYAVNSGVSRAVKKLQKVVGTKADGIMGPKTRNAAANMVRAKGAGWVIDEYGARRMMFYALLPIFNVFGLGWSRRLMTVHGESRLMAAGK